MRYYTASKRGYDCCATFTSLALPICQSAGTELTVHNTRSVTVVFHTALEDRTEIPPEP